MAGDAGFEPTMRESKSRALTNLANPHRWLAIQRGKNGHFHSCSGIPAPLRSAGSDPATGPGEGIRTPRPSAPKTDALPDCATPGYKWRRVRDSNPRGHFLRLKNVAWAVLGTAALTILPTLRDVMAGAASAFSGKATPRRREGNLALPPTGQMVGLLGFEPRINRL